VNLIQDYTYIYAFFFPRHHPNENNNNKQQKQQQANNRKKKKNHGKMNIKRNTNIWIYILSKDGEKKKRIHII
jgi:hypothetical protein